MADYTIPIGSGGVMTLRDTGWSVEMYIKAGSTATYVNGLTIQWIVNGVAGSASVNYPSGGQPLLVHAENAPGAQTVRFYMGASGTSGLGGPAEMNQPIYRAPPGGLPGPFDAPSILNITSNSAHPWWGPQPNNGSGITRYQQQMSLDAAFTLPVMMQAIGNPFTVSGLQRATKYYSRITAENAYGWANWDVGAIASFTTLATKPDVQAAPTLSLILAGSAKASWAAPNNGGSAITAYQLQIATDAAFSTIVNDATIAPLSHTPTGLKSSTQHWARTRSYNAIGWSDWSTSATFTTLAGVKVALAGTWVQAKNVWVAPAGSWVKGKIHRVVSGSWN